jgi:hypothetical protein
MKRKKITETWYRLTGGLDEFKNILSVLNRYYSNMSDSKSESLKFREEVILTKDENLEVFIKKFGTYEYIIAVKIKKDGSEKIDSWIHIDGIIQEREMFEKMGNKEHPVFSIIAITDIFLKQGVQTNEKVLDLI